MLILLPLQGHGETGVIKQLNLLHLMKVVLIGFVGDTKFSDSQSAVIAGLNARCFKLYTNESVLPAVCQSCV